MILLQKVFKVIDEILCFARFSEVFFDLGKLSYLFITQIAVIFIISLAIVFEVQDCGQFFGILEIFWLIDGTVASNSQIWVLGLIKSGKFLHFILNASIFKGVCRVDKN